MIAPVPFLNVAAALAEVRADADAAIRRVLDSGRFILGPEVAAFEAAFAPVAGCAHAVGVGNGLDGLAIALEAAGVRPGDEVIVPAHTFIATWRAVRQIGAAPVAAEPARGAFHVTLDTLQPAVTERTRAIVAVHLYGEPVEIEPIADFAGRRGLVLIEDAAQAHGAKRNGRPVGGFGDAAAFSFYPAKNLGALGDGGAVTTNADRLAAAARRLRNYGGTVRGEHLGEGGNSRLDPLQAAVLAVKLPRLAAWNARRRQIAQAYMDGLANIEGLSLPTTAPGNEPVWHVFVVRARRRDALAARLADLGVETLIHYPRAVYRTPAFAAFGPAGVTASDALAAEVLSLPMGPHMSDAQVAQVIEATRLAWRGIDRSGGGEGGKARATLAR
jgi:dTDP-3-amino-3,4,6-trideoxy-alpha-D-glucose transaminase